MKKHIFREYDVRGIVGKDFEIPQTYELGKAIVTYYKQQNPQTTTIIVARDGRSHSLPIKENVVKAITDLGLNVIDVGLCPTPALYYSLFNLSSATGMIITASHNPKEYNGIKICLDKKSVWGKQIQEIRKIYENKNFYVNESGKKGSIQTYDIITEYIDFLCDHFKHLKNLKIDCLKKLIGVY